MSPRTKVTLTDIARAAGVSPATVSMILSGREGVSFSKTTVARVRERATELAYVPSARKKAARLFGHSVLIICPNVINPYYSTLVQSIQQAARQQNVATLIYTTYRDAATESAILREAADSHLAGIVFAMMPQSRALVEGLNRSVPVVVIGDRSTSLNVDTVELDNYSAGVLIAQYMIEQGHKRIAYITTPLNAANSARVRRLKGLRDTFRQQCSGGSVLVYSREISPEMELNTLSIEHETGYALTKKCLEEAEVTAFVAVNDMVGYGVLDAVRGAGLRVPEDYSVCGFDNIFPSGFVGIGLTTVEHHIEAKGRHAFNMLFAKITGENSEQILRMEFRHHLIIRQSTARPR
ncbi:MAG: LacI family DNA-binding transcriptional regulator [Desulfovibrionaceae bacterium]